MKHIACVSGGKDSVATLIVARERGEPLDEVAYCEVMFDSETSGELPEHREFILEKLKPFVENEIGVPFVVLRSKKTYVDVFLHEVSRGENKGKINGFAIPSMCEINRDCKVPPIYEHIKKQGDCIQYVGIAADETKRLTKLQDGRVSLLAKYGVTEEDARLLCARRGLLSPSYKVTNRNGCWFCPNCKDREWVHIMKHYPDLFDRLIELEKQHPIRRRQKLTREETPSQLKQRLYLKVNQISMEEMHIANNGKMEVVE